MADRPSDGAQRRAFYRMADGIAVRLRFPALGEDAWHATRTLDYSGSGVGVTLDTPLAIGAVVELVLELPGDGEMETGATVASCRPPETDGGPHRVGLEFAGISDTERARVVRHVMRAQRRLRRYCV